MKVMKPIFRTKQYIKYGFVKMEHEYYCCPKCRNILNAGPNYQPEFCDRCGQALDFSNTEWKEVTNATIAQPVDAENGTQYVVLLKKELNGNTTYDAQVLTSKKETSEDEVKEIETEEEN